MSNEVSSAEMILLSSLHLYPFIMQKSLWCSQTFGLGFGFTLEDKIKNSLMLIWRTNSRTERFSWWFQVTLLFSKVFKSDTTMRTTSTCVVAADETWIDNYDKHSPFSADKYLSHWATKAYSTLWQVLQFGFFLSWETGETVLHVLP